MKKKTSPTPKHEQLLVLLLVLLVSGFGIVAYRALAIPTSQAYNNVLGDDDEKEDKKDDEDKEDKEDKKDDEDKKDKEDKKDNEEKKYQEKKEVEKEHENEKMENEIESKEKENEYESEKLEKEIDDEKESRENDVKEDEKEDGKNENQLTETILNDNGTTSVVKKHLKNGIVTSYEVKTYADNGILLSKREYENEGDKVEVEEKVYNLLGEKVHELKYKQEDGEEIKLEVEHADDDDAKVRYDSANSKLVLKNESDSADDRQLTIALKNDGFEVEQGTDKVLSKFPMTVDSVTGKIYVAIGTNDKSELKLLPGVVKDRVLEKAPSSVIDGTELIIENGNLVYKVKSTETQKLLGLFRIKLNKELTFDAQNGVQVLVKQSLGTKILDFLSFGK